MLIVLSALAKATGQLADPAILKVLAKTIGLTLLLFAGLGAALYFALTAGFAAFGWDTGGLAQAAAAALIAIAAGWLLFRVLALAVLQLFGDEIVAAVEQRHFPAAAARAERVPLRRDIVHGLRGGARALAMNALAAPIVIALWFTGVGSAAVFLAVNAVILGRELTEMAWFRHGGRMTRTMFGEHPVPRSQRWTLGAAIAVLLLIPGVNLVAPVIGAAAGTHLFHACRTRAGTAVTRS